MMVGRGTRALLRIILWGGLLVQTAAAWAEPDAGNAAWVSGTWALQQAGSIQDLESARSKWIDAALSTPHLRGFCLRVPWKAIDDNLSLLEAGLKIAREHNLDFSLRFMAGRHTPARVFDKGCPFYTKTGPTGAAEKVPAPFNPDGSPNVIFEEQYQALVTRLAAWCRANQVHLLHLAWYGQDWAELNHGKEVRELAGYTFENWLKAHERLIDIGLKNAGDGLAVELPFSGHGPCTEAATTFADYVVGKIGPSRPLFFCQANGWGPNGDWGAPNKETEAAFDKVWTKPICRGQQMIQPRDYDWPIVFEKLYQNRATYCEVYTPSFTLEHKAQLAEEIGKFAEHCQKKPPLPSATVASSPRAVKWHPGHYVFVGQGAIRSEHILDHFRGVQKMYTWKSCEPTPGHFDFSAIKADLALLKEHGKQLVLQMQYKAFGKGARAVPAWLDGPEYGGGVYRASSGSFDPVLWNAKVGQRMDALFAALGREFDEEPALEAVVLPETSPSVDFRQLPGQGVEPCTREGYCEALEQRMTAMRKALPHTVVIQYANFPREQLPELTNTMKTIGVGMGGPDVYPRPTALSDPVGGVYRLYAPLAGIVPLGAAVQSPDYSVANWKRTMAFNRGEDRSKAAVDPQDEAPIPAREFLRLAQEKLKLNYLFWSANPKVCFDNVGKMLAEPDLANDPAGGLDAHLPVKAFAASASNGQPTPPSQKLETSP